MVGGGVLWECDGEKKTKKRDVWDIAGLSGTKGCRDGRQMIRHENFLSQLCVFTWRDRKSGLVHLSAWKEITL